MQHYISLQGLNSCITSLHMLRFALVHRPATLLVLGALGRLSAAWEPQFPSCRCTCDVTCTPVECSDHGCTCWVTRLCACCALAVLVTQEIALAIAHGDRLPWFIIIVQTLDDVMLQARVAIIAPLTPNLGCHLHTPLRHALSSPACRCCESCCTIVVPSIAQQPQGCTVVRNPLALLPSAFPVRPWWTIWRRRHSLPSCV